MSILDRKRRNTMKEQCITEEDLHRYRARYDETIDRGGFGIPLSTKRVYVCDVCEKCGDVINRPKEEIIELLTQIEPLLKGDGNYLGIYEEPSKKIVEILERVRLHPRT